MAQLPRLPRTPSASVGSLGAGVRLRGVVLSAARPSVFGQPLREHGALAGAERPELAAAGTIGLDPEVRIEQSQQVGAGEIALLLFALAGGAGRPEARDLVHRGVGTQPTRRIGARRNCSHGHIL